MKFASTLLVGVLCAAAMVLNAAADHCAQEWGQCGKTDGSLTCCPNGFYCQPWDSGNIQCQKTPDQCEKLETNVDFLGNDIETVYGLQPGACCSKCAETKGCTAFTFINHRAGPPACYLKRLGGTNKKTLIGAVSGYVKGGKKLARAFLKEQKAGGCPNAAWGKCGDSKGSGCCPGGQYCQPWNPGFYQCIKTPPACPTQHTDMDLEGNDIGKAQAGTGEECCNACSKNSKCKAYTFVNFNNDGPQCYLKSAAGKKIRKVGAVSGVRS